MSLKRFFCRAVSAATVVALLAAGPAFAGTIPTSYGNGADTYVSNDSNSGPTVVHGAESSVNVRAIADSRARLALLRFDLSAVTSGALTGAQLQLNLTYGQNTRDLIVYGLNDGDAGEMWDESVTNYLNAPGIDLTAPPHVDADGNYHLDLSSLYGGAALGTWTFPSTRDPLIITSSTATLDLDAFLAADTDKVATFLIAEDPDVARDFWFDSKEGTIAPKLLLPNATVVPEPASLALVMVGLVAVGLLRRRR